MSWTNAGEEKLLHDFYARWFAPSTGVRPLDDTFVANGSHARSSPGGATYYHERTDDSDYVFEFSAADLSAALISQWSDPGMAPFAEALAVLAEELEDRAPVEEEISASLYVLF